jgi:hypothetical protein
VRQRFLYEGASLRIKNGKKASGHVGNPACFAFIALKYRCAALRNGARAAIKACKGCVFIIIYYKVSNMDKMILSLPFKRGKGS